LKGHIGSLKHPEPRKYVWTGESAFNAYPDYYFSHTAICLLCPGAFALRSRSLSAADPYAAGVVNLGRRSPLFQSAWLPLTGTCPPPWKPELGRLVDLMDMEILTDTLA